MWLRNDKTIRIIQTKLEVGWWTTDLFGINLLESMSLILHSEPKILTHFAFYIHFQRTNVSLQCVGLSSCMDEGCVDEVRCR